MNAKQIIKNSTVGKLPIQDTDKSLDDTKTFSDIKAGIARAINVINEALPKMKAAGVDMEKAAGDAEGLFRNIVRKDWGDTEVDFYITRDGNKAITAINQRHLDGIVKAIQDYIINF